MLRSVVLRTTCSQQTTRRASRPSRRHMNLFNSDIFCAMGQNPEHFPINCRVSFISMMHATRLANRLDSISRTQVSNFLQPPSFELVLRKLIPLETPPDFVTSPLNPEKSKPLRLSADDASVAGFTQTGLQLDEHGDVGVPAEGGGNQACAPWILGKEIEILPISTEVLKLVDSILTS